MKCLFCNNETELKKGRKKVSFNGKTVIITNVPTQYCICCTDEYYSADIVQKLEKILEIVKSYKIKDNKIVVDYEEINKTLDEIST